MVSAVVCDDSISSTHLTVRLRQSEEMALDQLMVMLQVEHSYRIPRISCRNPCDTTESLPYGEWRRKIVQWCFKVVDHFRLDREVVSCALNIFDRFLATKPLSLSFDDSCPCPSCQRNIDSQSFQLTAMSALYLAMKVYSDNSEEGVSIYRRLRLSSFVELSRGQFHADDITGMESTILKELKWKVHPPTPMTAVTYLLRLMPSHQSIPLKACHSYDLVLHVLHELARYLTELSVCVGSISSDYAASEVAYAAILVSIDLMTESALPFEVREAFSNAVGSISSSADGGTLFLGSSAIQNLQVQLRKSFWPEMLLDDCGEADNGHPISMARNYGLIDVSSLSSGNTRPSSPKAYRDWEGSPVSVTRGNY